MATYFSILAGIFHRQREEPGRSMGSQSQTRLSTETLRYAVWASSRSWWWIEKPGMLQPVRSQRVTHNWATELKTLQVKRIWNINWDWIIILFTNHFLLKYKRIHTDWISWIKIIFWICYEFLIMKY